MSKRVYDREAALRFVAMYANFSSPSPSLENYKKIHEGLERIPGAHVSSQARDFIDYAGLSDSERVLVERRYGLRSGVSRHDEQKLSADKGDLLGALNKLGAWAVVQRRAV